MVEKRKADVYSEKLNKFEYYAADDAIIEITPWEGEGFDISITNTDGRDRIFSLTDGELDAINYLVATSRLIKKD